MMNINYDITLLKNCLMYSLSQKIEVIVMIASIILYFCGLTYSQQNVWSFFFSVALICFIVGKIDNYVDMLFMKDTTFEYEPHYENWQKKQEVDV